MRFIDAGVRSSFGGLIGIQDDMMSAYANGLQKPASFDSSVRKFRVICVTHEIPIGSPANLPLFLQKLIVNRPLAMDFWGFVSKLSDREGGELTDDQLLAIVVEGVVKGELPPEDPSLKRTLDDLRAMLAGVDIPGPGQLEPEPFSKDEAATLHSEKAWQSSPQHPRDAELAPAPLPNPPAASHTAIPSQLDEALHRLELTNLELKHHLEAIDKRMSRLEPDIEASTTTRPEANQRFSIPVANEAATRPEERMHKPFGQPRLVLEPAPQPADQPFARKSGSLSSRVPLESYSETRGYGRAAASLLLVLILAAAAFAGYRYRVPLEQEVSVLRQTIQARSTAATPTDQATPQDAASNEEASSSQPQEASSSQPQQQEPAARQPSPQQALTPAAPASRNAPTTPATGAISRTPEHPSDSAVTRRSIAERVVSQTTATQLNGISSSELAGAVRVAPAVMEAKLVDSRVPAYPDSAKIQGVEGSVVMQAIISKDGTVKRVHVIQGDSRLRSAATDAVSKWRYRPYLIDGQPVDVATTITVEFDLDR